MSGPDADGVLRLKIGPFNNAVQSVDRIAFVISFTNGSWDNNSGKDYHIDLTTGGSQTQVVNSVSFVIHYDDDTWDNNNSQDYNFALSVPTSVREVNAIPTTTLLMPAYPNPFNPSTNVEFRIENSGIIRLSVFDMLGREIAVLVHETKPPGIYRVRWDASCQPSGIYFAILNAAGKREIQKMVLVR